MRSSRKEPTVVSTAGDDGDRGQRARRRSTVLLLIAAAAAFPTAAAAQTPPPGPPGPPPGNGADLPAPPGTVPDIVPPGTPGTIPTGATGPGLLSGSPVRFDRTRRRLVLPLACQANGKLSMRGRGIRGGTFARARYRCSTNRTTVTLHVTRKVAKRLARRTSVAATATVTQGGKTTQLSFTLRTRSGGPGAKGFWTDGRLQCSPDASGAPPAFLTEPDYTTRNPTPISTRGWVAWYTQAGGWHWLGVDGENAGHWDNWTAAATGIAQFHPGGAPMPIPYTWGPIAVPAGQGIYAVGVYEIVYWVGGKPDYQWQYVNAGNTGAVAAGGGTHYCVYP
jgi:hypothetical protein